MKKKIKMLRFIILLASLSVSVCQAADSFLVKKKGFKKARKSKRTLKEDIGEQTQSSFDLTTMLGKEVGTILLNFSPESKKAVDQKEERKVENSKKDSVASVLRPVGLFQINLSILQSRFSRMAECLINNQKPFKKATRANLKTTFELSKKVKESLTVQLTTIKSIGQQSQKKLNNYKTVAHSMQQCAENMKKVLDDMSADACLKNL